MLNISTKYFQTSLETILPKMLLGIFWKILSGGFPGFHFGFIQGFLPKFFHNLQLPPGILASMSLVVLFGVPSGFFSTLSQKFCREFPGNFVALSSELLPQYFQVFLSNIFQRLLLEFFEDIFRQPILKFPRSSLKDFPGVFVTIWFRILTSMY